MKPWTPLTHKTLRFLRKNKLRAGRYGIAVSGGADSVALAAVLRDLAASLGLQLVMLHIHHGGASGYRRKATDFCAKLAEEMGLEFHSVQSPEELRTEAEMRKFRRQELKNFSESLHLQGILFGHHADDLLETRLLRLIRGTGPQGLRAIHPINGLWVRPFLQVTREEILEDLGLRSLKFLDDPSNTDVTYLRNWLRVDFLPLLEARSPGALKRMAQSMELLVEALPDGGVEGSEEISAIFIDSRRLSRPEYLKLAPAQQRALLAWWLKRLRRKDYSSSQIEEIRKQLDISKKEHIFKVVGLSFIANAKQIEAVLEGD